jgi:hypothetical protein
MPNANAPTGTASAGDVYAAFVSYRHTAFDRRWAKWLHAGLETYRVPRHLVRSGAPRRLGRVFRDEEELAASADLSERINEALTRARHLVVVCSPRTPQSRWVDEEVKRFQEMGRGAQVLALLIEGEPASSFPPALQSMEPLAADVRPVTGESARTRRHVALLKLVAALLNVPYDELRRRDEERSRRRWIILGTSSSIAAAAFLGLAMFAFQQRDRAETELRISRAQNLAAQSQIAYASATRLGDTSAVPGFERGVLLALESLRTYPTIAGDQTLRAGMRLLEGAALEVRIDEGETLAATGPQAAWILIRGDRGERVFDREARSYRPAQRDELAAADASNAAADEIVARSPDGALTARRSDEGIGDWVFASAEVVKTGGGRRVALLPHEWHIAHAHFTRDSRYFVTVTARADTDASDPGATALVGSTVRVWDASTWRKLTEVSLAHQGGIGRVSASSDGEWLATTIRAAEENAGLVLLWPLPPKTLIAEACRRLTRNLSRSEWFTFVAFAEPRETCPGLPITSE